MRDESSDLSFFDRIQLRFPTLSYMRLSNLYDKAVDVVRRETGLQRHTLMQSEDAFGRIVAVIPSLDDPSVLFYKFLRPRDATGRRLTPRGEPAKGTTPTRHVPWARIVWPTLATTAPSPLEKA